nr:NADH dehydrogenase subunit 6 [Ischnobaenella hainana]
MMMMLLPSITMPFMKHPLSMGINLIIQTFIISTYTGLMMNSFWMSYILIIMMMSGMLILFMYMASIASNEKFHNSFKTTFLITSTFTMILIYSFMEDQMTQKKIWSSMKSETLSNDWIVGFLKLFNSHNLWITIFLTLYLFLAMYIISYMINNKEGPLRLKSN